MVRAVGSSARLIRSLHASYTFVPRERPQVMRAITTVIENMPPRDRRTLGSLLAAIDASFLRSNESLNGLTSYVGQHRYSVWLAPHLEECDQRFVNSVVAHQFAH